MIRYQSTNACPAYLPIKKDNSMGYADVYIILPGGSRELYVRDVMIHSFRDMAALVSIKSFFVRETGRSALAVIVRVQ